LHYGFYKKQWKQALTSCSKAANNGNVQAQHNLGNMYILGEGVAQDYVRAYMWLNIAAANGYSTAA
jgi:hypothetical protein